MAGKSTKKVTVTMNEETLDWLKENYPESTSNSQCVLMAINDARRLQEMMGERCIE